MCIYRYIYNCLKRTISEFKFFINLVYILLLTSCYLFFKICFFLHFSNDKIIPKSMKARHDSGFLAHELLSFLSNSHVHCVVNSKPILTSPIFGHSHQKIINQNLSFLNWYEHAKNHAISLICSEDFFI